MRFSKRHRTMYVLQHTFAIHPPSEVGGLLAISNNFYKSG